jgi:hypothetical protein
MGDPRGEESKDPVDISAYREARYKTQKIDAHYLAIHSNVKLQLLEPKVRAKA